MSKFIRLQMFKDQHSRKGYAASAPLPDNKPFSQWKMGYFVKSSKTDGGEEWKITKIDSVDGAMHHENCTVMLENNAGETRSMKGASLRSGYQFVSVGDVVEEPDPHAEPVDVPAREDVQYMTVNIEGIREFYQRKHGNEGSRVLMNDKTAYICADSPADISRMIEAVGGRIVGSPCEREVPGVRR